jgi:hypothetical protein
MTLLKDASDRKGTDLISMQVFEDPIDPNAEEEIWIPIRKKSQRV